MKKKDEVELYLANSILSNKTESIQKEIRLIEMSTHKLYRTAEQQLRLDRLNSIKTKLSNKILENIKLLAKGSKPLCTYKFDNITYKLFTKNKNIYLATTYKQRKYSFSKVKLFPNWEKERPMNFAYKMGADDGFNCRFYEALDKALIENYNKLPY